MEGDDAAIVAYRVVIAEQHIFFRRCLKAALAEEGSCEVVGEAGDGLDLLDVVDHLTRNKSAPHLAIVGMSIPLRCGIEAICRLKSIYPGMKILILTMYEDREYFDRAISAGADGYVMKRYAGSELFPAIEQIRQGEVYKYTCRSTSDWFEFRSGC